MWSGGNNKLLYCGAQDQYYTYTMFDVCALWIVKVSRRHCQHRHHGHHIIFVKIIVTNVILNMGKNNKSNFDEIFTFSNKSPLNWNPLPGRTALKRFGISCEKMFARIS